MDMGYIYIHTHTPRPNIRYCDTIYTVAASGVRMIDDDDDIHIVDMRRMHDELHYDYVYDARCIYSYRYINI